MGIVLYILVIFFVGGILFAIALIGGMTYIIKRKKQIRYRIYILICLILLLIISIVVTIGSFMMIQTLLSYW